jgi:hypothetical protein
MVIFNMSLYPSVRTNIGAWPSSASQTKPGNSLMITSNGARVASLRMILSSKEIKVPMTILRKDWRKMIIRIRRIMIKRNTIRRNRRNPILLLERRVLPALNTKMMLIKNVQKS